jgi:hypothetical protein
MQLRKTPSIRLSVALISLLAACDMSGEDLDGEGIDDGSSALLAADDDDLFGGEALVDGAGELAPGDVDTSAAVALASVTLTASDADIVNPERGYYAGVNLLAPSVTNMRAAGHSIGLAIVRLDAYKSTSIDAAFLSKLTAGFKTVRAAGVKVILRFTYNAGYTGDASLARITGHLAQLKPLLVDNADVIVAMQAGFIGAWGEWHSSTNGLDNTASRAAVLKAILAALPSSRAVQIRTPMYKDAALPGGPLSPLEAFNGSNRARVGHHNDCFLASSSDFGTYAAPADQWKDYVAQDSEFLPVGGETCAVNAPRSDCAAALAEMQALQFSYLNKEYKQEVLARWDSQGCGSGIRRRLGYRIAATRASYSAKVAPGGELLFNVDLKNTGFAAPFNKRPIYVVLRKGTRLYTAKLSRTDVRTLGPGTTSLALRLRVPYATPAGTYELGLWMPDQFTSLRHDPRYALQLANLGTWDAVAGFNILTRALNVDPAAGGSVVTTATLFEQIL